MFTKLEYLYMKSSFELHLLLLRTILHFSQKQIEEARQLKPQGKFVQT